MSLYEDIVKDAARELIDRCTVTKDGGDHSETVIDDRKLKEELRKLQIDWSIESLR